MKFVKQCRDRIDRTTRDRHFVRLELLWHGRQSVDSGRFNHPIQPIWQIVTISLLDFTTLNISVMSETVK
jgi:hypothetical protein